MQRRVLWYKFTDVSEICTAYVIREMSCLDERGSMDL
jgi:hypothetical protein